MTLSPLSHHFVPEMTRLVLTKVRRGKYNNDNN